MNTLAKWTILITGTVCAVASSASAVSPESVRRGQQLFEKVWTAQDPRLGNDGLGPIFNGESCVRCHHQGGIGGGGDSRFNARSIGIESMTFSRGEVKVSQLRKVLSEFYPGFIQPGGGMINTAPLGHHSFSPVFASLRNQILESAGAEVSEEGGSPGAEATRELLDRPIVFQDTVGRNRVTVKAKLFSRNTTALFGAGLIDLIDEKELRRQESIQSRHPEISGRLSLLRDGSVGRFGWRANASRLVHFVDRACANELGLKTKRRPQMANPTRPDYRNPSIDIRDDEIEAMSNFIASLPAPVQSLPQSTDEREQVQRGSAAFESIGCAGCHVPKLGPASGIYSDLLLHDMGPYLFDFDAAEPYVVRQTPVREVRVVEGSLAVTQYYGSPTSLSTSETISGYHYQSPRGSTIRQDYVTITPGRELGRRPVAPGGPGRAGGTLTGVFREELGLKRRLKPSMTSQEWRTPPLWGLRDSAPYMHDGRAETVLEAIAMHDGESAATRDRFLNLPLAERNAVLAFLDTLVAPPTAPQPAR